MILLLISFLAGMMTVLAPCVLPVLPIIIGGSAQGKDRRNPYVITASLALAIVLFTLLLKFSTLFIDIPQSVWSGISGGIIILFGLISLFPTAWDRVSARFGLSNRSEQLLADSTRTSSRWGDILIGLSLGPVFSSCSPTYFLILATVLPRSFVVGTVYLIAYAAGLALVLLLVSLLGQRFIRNARWAADPRGWFKRGLGVLFIIVGIFLLTGADRRLQTLLLEKGFFNITNVEQALLQKTESMEKAAETNAVAYPRYKEIVRPTGFVNTDGITLGELVGKKVILVDFMTYSCINCIRTFPYLNAWHETYKDQGLEIVGIHTPEFAFEKKQENVKAAMERYGIKFPIILDNDYATWSAYQNNYWPRKYLIDLDGNIVYDHIGEGGYAETEKKIQDLLREKAIRERKPLLPTVTAPVANSMDEARSVAITPETYFGGTRNDLLMNGIPKKTGEQTLVAREPLALNALALDGVWDIENEFAQSKGENAGIWQRIQARNVFFVSSAEGGMDVEVTVDGKPIERARAGGDVTYREGKSFVRIGEERLYELLKNQDASESHLLKILIPDGGLRAYTFTFG